MGKKPILEIIRQFIGRITWWIFLWAIRMTEKEYWYEIWKEENLKYFGEEKVLEGGGMNIEDMCKEWLKTHRYDGLCNVEFECGCHVDDLMPCIEFDVRNCVAGYAGKAHEGSKFDIYEGKRPDLEE